MTVAEREHVQIANGYFACDVCQDFTEGHIVSILIGDDWSWLCSDCAARLCDELARKLPK